MFKEWFEREIQTGMRLREDFVSSHLRAQIETLKSMLETMEIENSIDDGYLDEKLKRVEKDLYQLRELSRTHFSAARTNKRLYG